MQTWPILIGLFIGKRNSQFDTFELVASGLGILGAISSIIAYFKFYYHVTDKELVIKKGLFKKVHLDLPFERIQSINFKQNFLHQLLSVTEVEIESAGSKEKELNIDALSIEVAERLRKVLLEKKAAIINTENYTLENLSETEDSKELILQLSNHDLFKVGLTQNHFKLIGLLIGLIVSSFFYSYTFDIDPRDILRYIESYREGLGTKSYLLIAVFSLPILVLYSVISTFLHYYNLVFWRTNDKFQVNHGLFTRHEFAAIDRKIQILSWGRNPLEAMLGFFNLEFRQAHSENKVKTRFSIVGCDMEKINFVQQHWLNKKPPTFEKTEKISIHYFYRLLKYQSGLATCLVVLFVFIQQYWSVAIVATVWLVLIGLSWLSYKKKSFGISKEEVFISGGTVDSRYTLMPIYKVQNVSITQNYYQWSRALATVVIHTAAGNVKIPYIGHQRAIEILNLLIYKAERSNKSWR